MAAKKSARKKPPAKKPAAKSAKKPAKKKAATRRAAPARVVAKEVSGPRVVHWEVQASDPARQQQFFAELFGWTVDTNNPQNYGTVKAGGKDSIGGGIGAATGSSRVTVYVQVPDINVALAKAESLGGTTVMPRMDIGAVIMGQFTDLEGNIIGLVEGN